MGCRIHRPHPPRHPRSAKLDGAEFQRRETIEHAVENHRCQSLHRRIRDRHVADGGEIVVPAVEIRHGRQAILLVNGVQLVLAADMEQDRQARFLGHGPDRVEADMARRMLLRTHGRNHQRLGALLDRVARCRNGPVDIFQRHIGRGQKAPVDGTEVHHHPVVGLGRSIAQLHIVALAEPEIAEAERREHKLAGKA